MYQQVHIVPPHPAHRAGGSKTRRGDMAHATDSTRVPDDVDPHGTTSVQRHVRTDGQLKVAVSAHHILHAISAFRVGLCHFLALSVLWLLSAAASAKVDDVPAVQVVPRGDPVQISSGAVTGKTLASGVSAYLGIPYAAPPVRELRWREPQSIQWQGVFNADRFMPECIQPLRRKNMNMYFGEEATSENCLYLNVWVPPGARPDARLPVVVYIHGGAFTIGSSGMALYWGESVAQRGAVYVSFNYRVGAMGYMAHPELTAASPFKQSGNYGHLDQIHALKWVRDNIEKFGGDPSKVTIAGQSAGSISVSLLQVSPLAKGLFSAAVGLSGATWSDGGEGIPSLQEAERTGLRLQTELGAHSIDEMRQLPADRIAALQLDCQLGCGGSIRIGWANLDGYFLTAQPKEVFARREQMDVPLILGYTADEFPSKLYWVKDLSSYRSVARELFGQQTDTFLKLFPARTDAQAREMGRLASREGGIGRTMRNWAVVQTSFGQQPVYLALFSRTHPYVANVAIADQDPSTIGAYHTGDVPYWLGTLDSLNLIRKTREWTAADRALSNAMLGALVSFAQSGVPSSAELHWPAWGPASEAYMEFGSGARLQQASGEQSRFMAAQPHAQPTAPSNSPGLRD
ncbi:carboxylesterase/lipase family protein [Steroidobacter sp.]|uniref:carboxylesterase/lipase family protein n=1 Tax=Steroidobacter sp. TaxID=1978227 RepID=UPI002ED8285E